MYNLFMSSDFSEWITKKYIDWRGNSIGNDRSISKFAEMLGIRQNVVSAWMQKNGKTPTSQKNINALISHFGIEVYDVLGLSRPSDEEFFEGLPSDIAGPLREAIEEVRSSGMNKGTDTATPEDIERIRKIFEKHGVDIKVISN